MNKKSVPEISCMVKFQAPSLDDDCDNISLSGFKRKIESWTDRKLREMYIGYKIEGMFLWFQVRDME